MNTGISIAVLMTCFNRRDTTLRCLECLYSQELPAGVTVKIFLVDDGCTDGTGTAVKEAHPDIEVIPGTGSLFWCNGMRLAWDHAAKEDPDFYLWLNDDSMLLDGALKKLLATYTEVSHQRSENRDSESSASNVSSVNDEQASIIIGSCCDPMTGIRTYGGQRRVDHHPARLVPIYPEDRPLECDTFQGNVVLVPRGVFKRVGNMRSYSHAMGDTDYGYQAVRAGCAIWLTAGFVALCESNTEEDLDASRRSLLQRIKVLKKRLPPKDWFRFLWFHSGVAAFAYWPSPYLRVALGMKKRSIGNE